MSAFVNSFLTVVLIILAVMALLCLIKCVIGPRVADRVICINMMGTLVIVIIAILTIKMKEGYLADICVLYAMISFLAVVVLCKVYMGVYLERKARQKAAEKIENAEEMKEAENGNN